MTAAAVAVAVAAVVGVASALLAEAPSARVASHCL